MCFRNSILQGNFSEARSKCYLGLCQLFLDFLRDWRLRTNSRVSRQNPIILAWKRNLALSAIQSLLVEIVLKIRKNLGFLGHFRMFFRWISVLCSLSHVEGGYSPKILQ